VIGSELFPPVDLDEVLRVVRERAAGNSEFVSSPRSTTKATAVGTDRRRVSRLVYPPAVSHLSIADARRRESFDRAPTPRGHEGSLDRIT
jgi:hypothetical protein